MKYNFVCVLAYCSNHVSAPFTKPRLWHEVKVRHLSELVRNLNYSVPLTWWITVGDHTFLVTVARAWPLSATDFKYESHTCGISKCTEDVTQTPQPQKRFNAWCATTPGFPRIISLLPLHINHARVWCDVTALLGLRRNYIILPFSCENVKLLQLYRLFHICANIDLLTDYTGILPMTRAIYQRIVRM